MILHYRFEQHTPVCYALSEKEKTCNASRAPVPRQVHALGLEDSKAPVPISVFWLVPQYFIIGAAEILVNIGTMELFYSEVHVRWAHAPVLLKDQLGRQDARKPCQQLIIF